MDIEKGEELILIQSKMNVGLKYIHYLVINPELPLTYILK